MEEDLTDPIVASNFYREGNFPEALRRADAIIDDSPNIALSYRFKGEVLFNMNDFPGCLKSFERAELLGGKGTDEVFIWKALALANMDLKEKAIELLQKYLDSPEGVNEIKDKCHQAMDKITNS